MSVSALREKLRTKSGFVCFITVVAGPISAIGLLLFLSSYGEGWFWALLVALGFAGSYITGLLMWAVAGEEIRSTGRIRWPKGKA
jgi:hypothetical protein